MKSSFAPVFLVAAAGCVGLSTLACAQLALNSSGSYAQDFNTLPTSGTIPWVNNLTLAGWYVQREAGATDLVASTGSATGGAVYNFGAGGSNERALGSLGSTGTGAIAWGVIFQNTAATALTFGNLGFTGEEWRRGATGKVDTMEFDYRTGSVAATDLLAVSGWTAVNALDFTNPNTAGGAGALDGNNPANRVALSATLNLALAPGQFVTFRWLDPDHPGSDNGLAIDDFSLAYAISAAPSDFPVPEPSTWSVAAASGLLILSACRVRRRLRRGSYSLPA